MNNKLKLRTLLLTAALTLGLLAGCGTSNTTTSGYGSNTGTNEPAASDTDNSTQEMELLSGKHHAEIEVADYGTIKLELDADVAPITVTNFVDLAGDGFYDGLTFHRVVSGFMIQGGDPNGNGTGGSDQNIVGEFDINGHKNTISHVRGTISMARAQPNDSASSQFFIVHEDSTFLDGQYAAFGTVTEGIEVVDDICAAITTADPYSGLVAVEEQPVITSVTITD